MDVPDYATRSAAAWAWWIHRTYGVTRFGCCCGVWAGVVRGVFVGCKDRCDDGGIRTMTTDLQAMRACILVAVASFLVGVGALVVGSHTGLNAFGWGAGIAWGIAVVAAFVGLAIGLGGRP